VRGSAAIDDWSSSVFFGGGDDYFPFFTSLSGASSEKILSYKLKDS